MATPAVPQDLYSYYTLLRSELQRVHDRQVDRLEFGDTAASTPRACLALLLDGARCGSDLQPQPLPLPSSLSATPPYHSAETLPTCDGSI
ncbi:hypothetical protein R3P38DRAFT_3203980 [Favolaschia claudopus]|uniref:Uncharacterized protein n=1 Tax=Favolaschia claudopus TaxID=2862362 RepID=A0AAW0ASN7_9AGAR